MNIQNLKSFGITYIGVRTKHIDQTKQFAEQVLGYEKTHDDGDFVAFTTPQGQRFELHAEETPDKQFYPLEGAVAGFEVPDMDAAIGWAKKQQPRNVCRRHWRRRQERYALGALPRARRQCV